MYCRNCINETDAQICSQHNANCGSLAAVDDCGNMRTVTCGGCTTPAVCGGSGTPNVCGGTTLTCSFGRVQVQPDQFCPSSRDAGVWGVQEQVISQLVFTWNQSRGRYEAPTTVQES